MLEVEQIKTAVMNLSLPELTDFRKWYEEFEAQKRIWRLVKVN